MTSSPRPSSHQHPVRKLPPLDPASLEAAAVSYLERFQTSRARLVRLLSRKLYQRGWAEDCPPPDIEALADRMEQLGYVNDAIYAEARARGLKRRGMGAMRVRADLAAHGIAAEQQEEALRDHDSVAVAIAFARRRRFGPFGPPVDDPAVRRRQFAAMVRSGHSPDLARRIIAAENEDDLPSSDD